MEKAAGEVVSEQNNGNGGLVRLWCAECRLYGDHLTGQHPATTLIPDCQDYARFDTLDHAECLMNGMVEEFGGTMASDEARRALPCHRGRDMRVSAFWMCSVPSADVANVLLTTAVPGVADV